MVTSEVILRGRFWGLSGLSRRFGLSGVASSGINRCWGACPEHSRRGNRKSAPVRNHSRRTIQAECGKGRGLLLGQHQEDFRSGVASAGDDIDERHAGLDIWHRGFDRRLIDE